MTEARRGPRTVTAPDQLDLRASHMLEFTAAVPLAPHQSRMVTHAYAESVNAHAVHAAEALATHVFSPGWDEQHVVLQRFAPLHRREALARHLRLLVATILAAIVLGFHPFAEDGGLYAAGIEWKLNPALFPHDRAFVAAHMAYSFFGPAVAAFVRVSPLTLRNALFVLFLLSIWATLYAVERLAAACLPSRDEISGAVYLTAAWMSAPLAGTALMFTDPYVTARSVTLPCGILALACTLRACSTAGKQRMRYTAKAAILTLIGLVMHPLMGGYWLLAAVLTAAASMRAELGSGRGSQFVVTTQTKVTPLSRLHAFSRSSLPLRILLPASICLIVLLAAAAVYMLAPPETAAYQLAAASRTYWYPAAWRWYEWVGYLAPLVLIAWSVRPAAPQVQQRRALRDACLWGAGCMLLIACICAASMTQRHGVARLQPLRFAQPVFCVMLVLVGGKLWSLLCVVARRVHDRWPAFVPQFHDERHTETLPARPLQIVACCLCALPFWLTNVRTYPATPHIELASNAKQNAWVQAFRWSRGHTPTDALFAIDAGYIELPGEDAQVFRAIAQRSVLPDHSKDGGEASITPHLADVWAAMSARQQNLSRMSDVERLRLRALGVSWVVLQGTASTSLDCPYRQPEVKVCRLMAFGSTMSGVEHSK
jgi:hypothetical protein